MALTSPGPTTPQPPDPEFEQLLNVLNRGLSQIRDAIKEVDFGSSAGHAILSSDHTDIATGTVVRGDIIRGNSTPAWARLGLGASGTILRSDGTDLSYTTLTIPNTAARGTILYGSATNVISALAVGGTAGMFLRTDATDVLWSTLILPNAVTAGSVVFASAADTYGQDNANFFWDDTNNRLGIGTVSPSAPIQTLRTDAGTSGLFQNSLSNGTASATIEATGAGGSEAVSMILKQSSKSWTFTNSKSAAYFSINETGVSDWMRIAETTGTVLFVAKPQFDDNTTGAGSAALGSNSPAVTNTAPYTWIQAFSSDGSAVFIPCWK